MSEAVTPVPNVPAPKSFAVDKLADFSDRLSPMLVKELRQGLRAKTFVVVFLTLQVLLGFVLLASLGASSSPQDAGHSISGVIFMFFSIAVLVIQPMRGIGSLHTELKSNTMELMVLTRLSAWRIVLGKWIALVSQSALLLAAIVPYLILRYWFGDMNLFGELILLLLIFLGSALATAITVGLSAVPSMIIRGLLPLVGGVFLIFTSIVMSFGRGFQELVELCSMQDADSRWIFLIMILSGLYVGWTILGLGASMIAPAAENHSTLRRIVTFAALLIAILIALLADLDTEITASLALIICIPAIVMALSEPFHPLPPICHPFVKRGLPGKIAGRFLYPGWPSGFIFALLASGLGLFLCLAGTGGPRFREEEVSFIAGLLGTLIMPAALLGFAGDRIKNRFAAYLLIVVSSLILTFLMLMVSQAMPSSSRGFLWLFSWLPMVNMFLSEISSFNDKTVAIVSIAVSSIYSVMLLIFSLKAFRQQREVEDVCQSISLGEEQTQASEP
ncbi:hypothetical protein [Haloferula sp.]|uniref:hypothetical protein n=1 Tax=Haloferula sp. TaxID=2497595 RepID=UPI003C72E474